MDEKEKPSDLTERIALPDAVILCGGEGARIRHLLPEGVPKIMADINGRPFLQLLLGHLLKKGFQKFILANRAREYEQIRHWQDGYEPEDSVVVYLNEPDMVGTCGAIRRSQKWIISEPFWIFNGDTLCDVDYGAMRAYHEATNSVITVACDSQFRHVGTFLASKRYVDLILEADGRMDMAEVFTLLGQRHEPVGWFMTGAPFHDIGSPEGLGEFRRLWR